jgi:hypothetical protein
MGDTCREDGKFLTADKAGIPNRTIDNDARKLT